MDYLAVAAGAAVGGRGGRRPPPQPRKGSGLVVDRTSQALPSVSQWRWDGVAGKGESKLPSMK